MQSSTLHRASHLSRRLTRGLLLTLPLLSGAIALAQPVANVSLPTLTSGIYTGNLGEFAANEVRWLRFTIPPISSSAGDFLDIDLNGGTLTGADTVIGLYDNNGLRIGRDDDDGPDAYSMLSFGRSTPSRPGISPTGNASGSGLTHSGSDGATLAGGTYWLGIVGKGSPIGGIAQPQSQSWIITGPHSRTGNVAYRIEFLKTATGAAAPIAILGKQQDNIIAGNNPIRLYITAIAGTSPSSTGLTARADLSTLGGSATQSFFDNGTNGDEIANDNIFTYTLNVPAGFTPGSKSFSATVSDAQGRTSAIATTSIFVHSLENLGSPALPTTITRTTSLITNEARFYRITLPAINDSLGTWFDIATSNSGNTFDTEICLFDSLGNKIAEDDDDGAGNLSALSFGKISPARSLPGGVPFDGRDGALAAGTYYLAVASFDATFNPTTWNTKVAQFASPLTNLITTFDLGSPSNPSVAPIILPDRGPAGSVALLIAQVTPGQSPISTGLAVTVNGSAVNAPSSITLRDDGIAPDGAAGDGIFSSFINIGANATLGLKSLPITVTDLQGRTGTGAFGFTVTRPTPANATCSSAQSIAPNSSTDGYTDEGGIDSDAPNCGTDGTITGPGVWYHLVGTGTPITIDTLSSPLPNFDTKLSLFCGAQGCGSLSCIASNDDAGGGRLSSITFCSQSGSDYYILVHGFADSQGSFRLTSTASGTPCTNPIACLPVGACCTGSGCISVAANDCAALGGTYLGDGASCSSDTLTTLRNSVDSFPIVFDNSTITSTITFPPGSGTVQNLAVSLDIAHSFIGDLTLRLTKGATTVTLLDRPGSFNGSLGFGADLQGEYTFADAATNSIFIAAAANTIVPPGLYLPSRAGDGGLPTPSLSIFNGQPLDGTWTLTVIDSAIFEAGTLRSFGLGTIESISNCSTCPPCAADFNQDGGVDGGDVEAFFIEFAQGSSCADVDQDGGVTGSDVEAFFTLFVQGGC